MTHIQKIKIMAFANSVHVGAQGLLKVAQELNDKDVDTAILIADSVRHIATCNSAILDHINGITNSLDAEINLEQSFEDFKKTLSVSVPYGPEDFIPTIDHYNSLSQFDRDTIPTNGRYDMIGKEINQFIP